MRFVGQTEVAAFLASSPVLADPVRAWLTEIKHRHWNGFQELAFDFRSADVSAPPEVVFNLAATGVRIATLVDFRNEVVLLTSIQRRSPHLSELPTRKEYRGH
ncbi:mRNA-degrading endonuclease HigB of HigAB toxin-antitoxin module [Bradyrhizobium sp. LM6.10]